MSKECNYPYSSWPIKKLPLLRINPDYLIMNGAVSFVILFSLNARRFVAKGA
jgi:hypothetical protein